MTTTNETIDAPVDQVIAALTDRAFQEQLGNDAGGPVEEFEIDGEPSSEFVLTVVRKVADEKIPPMAKSFVGDTLRLTQVERWSGPSDDGARSANIDITFGSIPVSVTAQQSLKPTADGAKTELSASGDVSSSVPFMGARIAALVEPVIADAVAHQAAALQDWVKRS